MKNSRAYPAPPPALMTPDSVRQWREDRGLTQNTLAALLGLSRSAYIYLEKGDPRRKVKTQTIPRSAELALRGLDAEMEAAYGARGLDELRSAYAKTIEYLAAEQRRVGTLKKQDKPPSNGSRLRRAN